ITPLSHTFCADCNRLRLTSRGELRLCLFADRVHPLRHLLVDPDPDAALEEEILRVLQDKPAEHRLTQGNYGNLVSFMQIGPRASPRASASAGTRPPSTASAARTPPPPGGGAVPAPPTGKARPARPRPPAAAPATPPASPSSPGRIACHTTSESTLPSVAPSA